MPVKIIFLAFRLVLNSERECLIKMATDGFFCFSLHTGAVLLGWLGFVSAFFSIIGWSLSFNNIDDVIKVSDDYSQMIPHK